MESQLLIDQLVEKAATEDLLLFFLAPLRQAESDNLVELGLQNRIFIYDRQDTVDELGRARLGALSESGRCQQGDPEQDESHGPEYKTSATVE